MKVSIEKDFLSLRIDGTYFVFRSEESKKVMSVAKRGRRIVVEADKKTCARQLYYEMYGMWQSIICIDNGVISSFAARKKETKGGKKK